MLALFTSEQQMLGEVVADLAGATPVSSPADLNAVDRSKIWRSLADAGLLGLRQRDDGDKGAPVASGVEALIVAERLAYRLVPVPFIGSAILAVDLLARAGAAPEVIEAITSGEVRYGIALSRDLREPVSSHGEDAIVFDSDGADFVLEFSQGSEGISRRAASDSADRASADLTRRLSLLPEGSGEPVAAAVGESDYQQWLALALTVLAGDIVGTLSGALDQVVDYSKSRVQFGVPIGSFQAVQHMCAEAYVKIEAARSTAKYAAWAVDELDSVAALTAARTAKAYASGVVRDVGETVMQVYGGIGQTWDSVAHLYLRRGLLDRAVLGDERAQLDALADLQLGSS